MGASLLKDLCNELPSRVCFCDMEGVCPVGWRGQWWGNSACVSMRGVSNV